MHENTKEGLRTVKKFGFFTFGATLAGFAIRLLKNIILTRILGPADRGIFGLFITMPNYLVGFGNLGFGLGNVFLVANRRYDLKKIFGNTLVTILILGPILSWIGYIVFSQGWVLKNGGTVIHEFLPCALAVVPFLLLYEFNTDLIVAIKDIHFVNILNLALSAFPILFFLLFWVVLKKPLNAAIYSWVVSMIIIGLWATIRVLKKTGHEIGFSKKFLREALSYGRRGFINIFANQLILRIDFLFVSSMLGAEALGYYAVSVSLVEILLSLPNAFNLPFLPVRLGMNQEKDSSDFTSTVIRHILFVMLVVCILTAITGKILIWLFFGKRFLPAYPPLLWLLPGILALSVYNFLRTDFYSHDMPGFVSWVSLAALFSNLVLNYLLIPKLGISGAAISSSVAYGLSTILLLFKHQHMSQTPFRDILLISRTDLSRVWHTLK